MNVEQATLLAEALEEAGHDTSVREEYSGRGMYGKTTAAIVTDASPMLVGYCWRELERREEEGEFDDKVSLPTFTVINMPIRSDNMGLSMVYY